ncbi:MAG: hypothetical protein LBU23_01275 [Planctomycetota bacterium]|jgi:hypothetical protein|nr:hypothetical protein [Planctomycetota bacterium]
MATLKLSIDAVTSGMRLAEALTDAGGAVLIPAGIRLTPIFVNRIKKWGIKSIAVLTDDSASETAPAAPAVIASAPPPAPIPTPENEEFAGRVADWVSGRFANVGDDPLMTALRDIVVRHLAAHGNDGPLAKALNLPGDWTAPCR